MDVAWICFVKNFHANYFSIIFFFLITPIALLQRLFKESELKTKFSKIQLIGILEIKKLRK